MPLDVRAMIATHGLIDAMQRETTLAAILEHLVCVIEAEVPGDVVELGCFEGGTSIYLTRVLEAMGSRKRLHVYDSFEGLPSPGDEDGDDPGFQEGHLYSARLMVVLHHVQAGLRLPAIHAGWFGELPASAYPEPICFAYFDGDLYQSIMDSFERVYPRVPPGGVICVHDYEYPRLPGVRRACDEYLAGRRDEVKLEVVRGEVDSTLAVITKLSPGGEAEAGA